MPSPGPISRRRNEAWITPARAIRLSGTGRGAATSTRPRCSITAPRTPSHAPPHRPHPKAAGLVFVSGTAPTDPPARQGARLPARVPGLKVSVAAIAEA